MALLTCHTDFSVCTFEDDLCGWMTTKGSQNFSWHRDTYKHLFDYTLGSANAHVVFIIFDSRLSSPNTTSSQLQIVQVTPSDNVCALRFAYQHYFSGDLTVEMNRNVLKRLQKTAHAGINWVVEVVSLKVDRPVSIQFVMKPSSDDIWAALDDIQFIPCTCEFFWLILINCLKVLVV